MTDYIKVFEILYSDTSGSNRVERQIEYDKKNAEPNYKIRLGYDKTERKKFITFQLNEGGQNSIKMINYINKLKSIRIDTYKASVGDHPGMNYSVKLMRETEENPFYNFIDSLIGVVVDSAGTDIIENLLKRILAWIKFFESSSSGLLSHEKQIGLFAELSVMKDFLVNNPANEIGIVNSWKGPLRENQDFIFETSDAIEVKCTTSNNNMHVSISNEFQLYEKGLNSLFLCIYQVKRHKYTSGSKFITLSELVQSLKDLLASDQDALMEFENLLISAEYLTELELEYDKYGFQIVEGPLYYKVDSAFPKITPLTLGNNNLSSISYSLSLEDQNTIKGSIHDLIEL